MFKTSYKVALLAKAVCSSEATTKLLLKKLEKACSEERKSMRSAISRRRHKSEVHAHSVIKPDGTLIGCVMSAAGATMYAKNHGGKVTRVVLQAVN